MLKMLTNKTNKKLNEEMNNEFDKKLKDKLEQKEIFSLFDNGLECKGTYSLFDNKPNYKEIFSLFILLFAVSCVQDVAPINDKENNRENTVVRRQPLQPSYMKGSYITTADNKVVRDLKKEGREDVEEREEIEKKEAKNLREINRQEANTKDESDEFMENEEIEKYEKSYNGAVNKNNRKIKTIKVVAGDSMLGIARKYQMTLGEVAELNNKKPPYNIYVGQKLKVYSNDDIEEVEDDEFGENMEKSDVAKDNGYRKVRIRSGDNLTKIAYENGTTSRAIAELNGIKPPYKVYIGQVIKVPLSSKNYYIVEKGDNIYSISKKTNVSFGDLVLNNNLEKPYKIYVGQRLYLRNSSAKGGGKNDNKNNISNKNNKNNKQVERVKNNENIAKNNANNVAKTTATATTPMKTASDGSLFVWPVKGEIVKKFGKQANGEYSDAINIKASQGTSVLAADAGEVAYAGNELKGYGNMIIIKHSNGWLSIYGHCDSMSVKVKDKVAKGQTIAKVGKTGNVSEPQLYFAVRKGRIAMDPLKYLSSK